MTVSSWKVKRKPKTLQEIYQQLIQRKMTTSILALEILLEQGCPFLTKETTEIGTIKYIYKYIPREQEIFFIHMSLEQTETGDWLLFTHSMDFPPKLKTLPSAKLNRFLAYFTSMMWSHLVNLQILTKAKRDSDLHRLVDILGMMHQQYKNYQQNKNNN